MAGAAPELDDFFAPDADTAAVRRARRGGRGAHALAMDGTGRPVATATATATAAGAAAAAAAPE
jgi:hypothetical protein